MDTTPEATEPPLPPSLRALRRLVMALTVVMIVGFLVLIGALVMRLNADGPFLPDAVMVPNGEEPTAFTQGGDWMAIVVRDEAGAESILIYDRLTARLRQTVRIEPARP